MLRHLLREPQVVDPFGGDLVSKVQEELVDQVSGTNLARREALGRKIELMRTELAGPIPSPLESLLVNQIVLCWLHLQDLDYRSLRLRDASSPKQADYYQRILDQSHRRYLSAIKTLAMVRRLALPGLQANTANQQEINHT